MTKTEQAALDAALAANAVLTAQVAAGEAEQRRIRDEASRLATLPRFEEATSKAKGGVSLVVRLPDSTAAFGDGRWSPKAADKLLTLVDGEHWQMIKARIESFRDEHLG